MDTIVIILLILQLNKAPNRFAAAFAEANRKFNTEVLKADSVPRPRKSRKYYYVNY